MTEEPTPFRAQDTGPFCHGTKANRREGELLAPGYSSNFGEGKTANFIYLTAALDAAVRGAELAVGEAPGRIHRVWNPRALSRTTPT